MNAQKMWDYFTHALQVDPDCVDVWSFGEDTQADALAQKVLSGEKTAMSSPYALYSQLEIPLPAAGDYSVLLDSRQEAVCILRTTKVTVIPFDQVTEEHALREAGEDGSLLAWRRSHRRQFAQELMDAGLAYASDMQVVCEEFVRVYP